MKQKLLLCIFNPDANARRAARQIGFAYFDIATDMPPFSGCNYATEFAEEESCGIAVDPHLRGGGADRTPPPKGRRRLAFQSGGMDLIKDRRFEEVSKSCRRLPKAAKYWG